MWLAKRYPSNLISVFLTEFRYFSYQVATLLSSRGWVDTVPDPIFPEKFLGYSWESNPGSLGWQSDVLITIPTGTMRYYSKINSIREIFLGYVSKKSSLYRSGVPKLFHYFGHLGAHRAFTRTHNFFHNLYW